MPEWNLWHFLGGHQITAQQAGDVLAVFFGDGSVQAKSVFANRVPLPAKADDGETAAEEPRVANVVRDVPVAAVHKANDPAVPAIGVLEDHRSIALVRIFGSNGNEVGGEFDFAVFQVHGVGKIDDAFVMRICHRDREINAPSYALVGSHVAKRLAIENILTRCDLDAKHTRI